MLPNISAVLAAIVLEEYAKALRKLIEPEPLVVVLGFHLLLSLNLYPPLASLTAVDWVIFKVSIAGV